MKLLERYTVLTALLFLAAFFFFSRGLAQPGLEYRDDEIFYYRSTIEMIDSGNYLSPKYFGEDRFQKPILFYWLILISYKIFGVSWESARLVSSLFAAGSLCLTWLMGLRLFHQRSAALAALILAGVPLFFRHAKNAVPDMALNFFVVLAMFYAWRIFEDSSRKWDGVLFFGACAVGFMIKGFTALLIPFLSVMVFGVWSGQQRVWKSFRFGKGILVFLIITLPWFAYMILVHGQDYFNHMFGYETKYRVMGTTQGGSLLPMVKGFGEHLFFYFRNLVPYFAPWSVLFLLGFGWVVYRIFGVTIEQAEKKSYQFLMTWIVVVIVFFSFLYFVINHYLLLLSTPFALLTGHFLASSLSRQERAAVIVSRICRFTMAIIFTAGCIGFSFFLLFWVTVPGVFAVIMFCAGVAGVWAIIKFKSPIIAATVLGFFIIFVYFQKPLIYHSGVVSHPVLAEFAEVIKQDKREYAVGVGSHDIHEKELQIFLNQKVFKAGTDHEGETNWYLSRLFLDHQRVYCLMTEKDFNHYLKISKFGPFEKIHENYLIRRKMQIDKGFWLGLMRLDRETVRNYLMEKVILVVREPHAQQA